MPCEERPKFLIPENDKSKESGSRGKYIHLQAYLLSELLACDSFVDKCKDLFMLPLNNLKSNKLVSFFNQDQSVMFEVNKRLYRARTFFMKRD